MAEQSLSIKDLIENLDVAGGGAYKGKTRMVFTSLILLMHAVVIDGY